MMGTANSWLMRMASSFAQLERSIKAVPIQPGELYPPRSSQSQSTHWINWQGWSEFEKQSQSDGRQDLANAKTAVTSPWVFADVQAIANEFSTAELIVKERTGTKLEDVENHPLERLWESPNEHMGRSFVTSFWAWSYTLASKAYLYWVPDTGGRELMEVWPVPPWMIRAIPDPDDFIRGYAFRSRADGPITVIPPEYMTYSHSVNLFDVRDGMSFLVAAMTEINADLAASQWNLNFFDENNGLPDGMISANKDILDQDLERIRFELRDFFGGTKRGLAVARAGDFDYEQFGRSQKDMEFGSGREFASKVIGRTLGFPDGYWSDLANRANAEQARRTMISGAVWPLLVRLAEDMNAKRRGVVQRWYGENTRVEFKDIRPEDRELQLREFTTYQAVLPVGRLLERIGEKPLGDVRDEMLVAEITKGAPLPGTKAAQQLEDEANAKAEEEAQQQAAAIEAGEAELPPEGEAPPEEGEVLPVEEETAIVPMKAVSIASVFSRSDIPPTKAEAVTTAGFAPGFAFSSADTDLEKWQHKALKSLRRFHKADVAFESDSIPLPEQVAIHAALKAADSVEAVKAAFKRDAVDTLLDDVDEDARAWAEEATE